MRKIVIVLLFALPCSLVAQTGAGLLVSDPPKGVSIAAIIQSFAAKEKEFKQAREQYTYTRDVTVSASCQDGKPGVYHLLVNVTFDKKGKSAEKVEALSSTLTCIYVTKEDLDFFRNQSLLLLTTDEIQDYQINFVGEQQDNSHFYVFDVSPIATTPGKPSFEGRIWVDGVDFRIVKSQGTIMTKREKKRTGQENLFPAVTTWREQIDGRYWFPTSSHARDVLHFSGHDVQIDEIVKITNLKAIGH
jgi:hypothetical protein